MARQLSVIVCLVLACSNTCLAGIAGLRGAAQEQADAGSPQTEESSSQVANFGVGQDLLLSAKLGARDIFKRVDSNGDGFVSPAEAHAALRAALPVIGLQATQTTLADKLVKAMDSSGDGKISLDEFLKYVGRSFSQQDTKKLFRSVDLDGNGFISKEELISMHQKLGVEVKNAPRFDAVFRRVDRNGDGQLDLAEFVAVGLSHVAALLPGTS